MWVQVLCCKQLFRFKQSWIYSNLEEFSIIVLGYLYLFGGLVWVDFLGGVEEFVCLFGPPHQTPPCLYFPSPYCYFLAFGPARLNMKLSLAFARICSSLLGCDCGAVSVLGWHWLGLFFRGLFGRARAWHCLSRYLLYVVCCILFLRGGVVVFLLVISFMCGY